MHQHDLAPLAHSHQFTDGAHGARRTAVWQVTWLTLATMAVELVAGWWSGSLALLADGAHMGTHALALGGAAIAYHLSERASHARVTQGYAFGGWKIEVLAAYTSALMLLATALWLVWEAALVLRDPRPVAWNEAMLVAVLGLAVNLASAWLLARGRSHDQARHDAHDQAHEAHDQAHRHAHPHTHEHAHSHAHSHARSHAHSHAHSHARSHVHDHNFSAAYVHVIADALTSVLAILALAAGSWFGIAWLDPVVAFVGAVLIGQWALSLLAGTARALVDNTADPALARQLREHLESDGDARVADLHVWQVGGNAWCAALSVVADAPQPAAHYRARLAPIARLRHVTIEVHRCSAAAGAHEANASST